MHTQAADRERPLAGREIAITGRLASMSRDEARQRIVSAGGSYVARPGEGTSMLVIGQDGPPVGDDGRLTRNLSRARELRARGQDIRIVPEEEFLQELGLEERHRDLHRLYTTAQLGRMLEVPPATVRAWVRHGLIQPAREVKRLCFFDFQQVANARALSSLARQGVTPARIRESLQQAQEWLPGAKTLPPLKQLEAMQRRGPLHVRLDDGRMAEASGQLLLDFEAQRGATPCSMHPREAAGGPTPQPLKLTPSVVDWFGRGLRAEEEGNLEAAVDAYERALRQDYSRAETWFNLGNVLYTLERRPEAVRAFTRATGLEPDYVEAWNNLGNALSEGRQWDDAVDAYENALRVEPTYMDAHYNLAETLWNQGNLDAARKHWREYLRLDPNSKWAQRVRDRLGE